MRRAAAAMFGVWALLLSILGAAVVGTTMLLPFWPVPRGRRERFTIVGAQIWARFVIQVVLLCRVKVEGSIPHGDGALLVCNHRSWLDPLLLIGWTRSNGLSKKQVLYIPAVGFFGWLSGAVYFDRRDPAQRAHARDEVMRLIRSGHRIQLFPEGTRTTTGRLREKVYLTLVRDAWEAKVPVVPCAVFDTERVLPVDRWAAHPLQKVRVKVLEALQPADFESADAFAEAAWQRVREAVGES